MCLYANRHRCISTVVQGFPHPPSSHFPVLFAAPALPLPHITPRLPPPLSAAAETLLNVLVQAEGFKCHLRLVTLRSTTQVPPESQTPESSFSCSLEAQLLPRLGPRPAPLFCPLLQLHGFRPKHSQPPLCPLCMAPAVAASPPAWSPHPPPALAADAKPHHSGPVRAAILVTDFSASLLSPTPSSS